MLNLPVVPLSIILLGVFANPIFAETLPSKQPQDGRDFRAYEITMPGQPRWHHVIFGERIGVGLFDVHDLNGDGELELITSGGGNRFNLDRTNIGAIFVLRSDLQESVCVLQELNSTILAHSYIQSGTDSNTKLILVTDTEVLLFDPMKCWVETQFSFPAPPNLAKIGRLTGGPEPEIVFSSHGHLRVTPWNQFFIIAERLDFNARTLAVGQVTAHNADSIVAQSESLQILDGATLETLATIPNADADFLAAADLDGDGIDEIVSAKEWTEGITAYSSSTLQPLFNVPVFNLGFLSTQDIDGDGQSEILYADRQHGGVHVLNSSGEPLYYRSTPSRASGFRVADIRPEEGYEIVYSFGASNTRPSRIFVADAATSTILERTSYYTDSIGIEILGEDRIVVGYNDRVSSEIHGSTSRPGFYVMDRNTGNTLSELDFHWGESISNIESSITASTTLTGDDAGVICIPLTSNPRITCFSTVDLSVVWERTFPGARVREMTLMDVTQDGIEELLSLHSNGYLYAHSQVNGFLLWRSEFLDVSFGDRGWNHLTNVEEEIWLTDGAGDLLIFERSSGDLMHIEEQANLAFIQKHGNEYFAVKQGVGYGRLDVETKDLELLYPATNPVNWLELSKDGRFLLLRSTADNVASVRIIDLVNNLNEFIIGDLKIIDSQFVDMDELILVTSAGIFSYSLAVLDSVFSDRFITNEQR